VTAAPFEVAIVKTGAANVASVASGFERIGGRPALIDDEHSVRSAPLLVLPGVGSFGAAVDRLSALSVFGALRERTESGRPTLAICLGMQLLFEESAESPGVRGLGIIPRRVEPFPEGARRPHMGWNEVVPQQDDEILRPGFAYFANSFRVTQPPTGWLVGRTDHAGPFVSTMRRGAVLACQFHPELSGAYGLELMARWAQAALKAEAAPC